MREDNDFADVTLACEDDQQVEAHKVILAGQVLFLTDYFTVIVTSTSTLLLRSRQEAAAGH